MKIRNPGMDRLASLNVFVQVAEAGSFVAAGRQLGVSASAVGKSIARLEERLGVLLFHRSTRSMALTPEGGLFLERCRRIFGEVEAAEQELSDASTQARGPLRVSVPLAHALLMPVLAAFMADHPRVRLELDFTDRLVDVIEEGFDAVLRTGEAADSRLMSRKLGTFRHHLVASPAYLARHGMPRMPADLLGHACLHHRHPLTGALERWPLARNGAPPVLDLPVAAVVSTLEGRAFLAGQGLGIACLPSYAVRRELADGTLVSLLDEHMPATGTISLIWPASRYLSPRIRAFVDFLARHLVID